MIVQLEQRLQVTAHVFKAQRALAAHQAIAHQQQAIAAHQAIAHQQQAIAAHRAIVHQQQALQVQSNAPPGQSTVATEHVRKHQVQALAAAALQVTDLGAHQHIRLQQQATQRQQRVTLHQQRATVQDQATLAALFSVQPGQLMRVTEHVRKIQAQATDQAQAIQALT